MSEGLRVGDLDLEGLIGREWLVANGLGGYASATVVGMNTRRYHGLLVAAMAPPVRRMVLLSRLEETVVSGGREFYLACNTYPNNVWPRGFEHLRAFSTEPFPRWGYQGDGWTIEKQLRLLRGENTVVISYTLLGGMQAVELELRPMLALRGIHHLMHEWHGKLQAEPRARGHWRVPATQGTPEVFFAHDGNFEKRANWYLNTIYRREQERGYPGVEDLWTPGVVQIKLTPGQPAYFACSADPFELTHVVARAARLPAAGAASGLVGVAAVRALTPQADANGGATNGAAAATANGAAPQNGGAAAAAHPPGHDADYEALVRAADAFVLNNRQGDSAACTVQYHWSSPSPRPALAAFTGLYLVPGRFAEAKGLLTALVPWLDKGLLPTAFPEDGADPVYAGADVSLWYVNAVWQYLLYTGDAATVRRQLMDPVFQIVDHYRQGTGLGIHVDGEGLLVSRAAGVPTTWMDAKSGDWVVTPRAGRAVDVNALWYNALCVAADLARRFEPPEQGGEGRAGRFDVPAAMCREAFNRRFWNDAVGCCYDVVDGAGSDPSVRPNQLLAISLPFAVLAGDPVLSEERQIRVLDCVTRHLLIPYGVRTLWPKSPDYCPWYSGGESSRDRAYHNGSAFPWLLGPLVTALVRTRGREGQRAAVVEEARRMLRPCLDRLRGDGLGQLNELFEGNSPHTPAGAIASPWSVGELLRCYAEDILGRGPAAGGRVGTGDSAAYPAASDVAHPA